MGLAPGVAWQAPGHAGRPEPLHTRLKETESERGREAKVSPQRTGRPQGWPRSRSPFPLTDYPAPSRSRSPNRCGFRRVAWPLRAGLLICEMGQQQYPSPWGR